MTQKWRKNQGNHNKQLYNDRQELEETKYNVGTL